ncbi:LOW QUALITY PROTEIN: RNA/RNP complex-1-interacting phosphatase-like [Neophocaena asiaeorientalis asiaeorientalis]|uniref:LOW QUALITY PROTEIN: RNA/RNP complex-1-interacting phosphatase-like n=1 Tax=Neophocaena asiaeorientalis asiaeorientalis TaxID=1706337 RepID=A0A341CK64_NEOAA|nr:LOW QUALITY PROTEIN: RNA/RNP complex-1-interacting phosphatase-like [Neophocaena asiaeorientalis asiaeorientalis]
MVLDIIASEQDKKGITFIVSTFSDTWSQMTENKVRQQQVLKAGQTSGAKRKGGKHITERWKDYLPVEQWMPGTCFIAFKVPLKKSFEKNLAPKECFSPLDLFNKIQEQNEELGLITDLTYTHCYYKPEDLPETIPYLKICTTGHQVSDDDTIFKFQCAVNGFLKDNKDNDTLTDRLIGVHCTHGINRTGYHMCRYLIDVEGVWPDDAIGYWCFIFTSSSSFHKKLLFWFHKGWGTVPCGLKAPGVAARSLPCL